MKLPRPGLRGKLAFAIALVLLAALGATYFAVYRGTGAQLQDRTEADIERESEILEANLARSQTADPKRLTARARTLVGTDTFGPNARVISISVDGGGTATNQPELLRPHDHGADSSEHDQSGDDHEASRILDAEPGFSTVEIDDVGEVRLLSRQVKLPGGNQATITVGQPLAPVDAALQGLSDTFVLVALAALILGTAAGWVLASTATRPMRRMASLAEGIDAGDLSTRMPTNGTRDEARRLAESFNGMLDRLEDAFDRQRTFVADASHDLRTPLTVVKGQVEVLARNPNPSRQEVAEVAAAVTQATARMERMVDDLLLLARAEADDQLRRETVELGPLLAGEVEGFGLADRRIELGEVTAQAVSIDREQFSRAVSNLLSNSVRHTETDGRIELAASVEDGWVAVSVDDDGPGVPAADRDRVFDRFSRLDKSRSSADGGSGLGLAIVKAVAESHGGRVECLTSPLGGARFRILVPAAIG